MASLHPRRCKALKANEVQVQDQVQGCLSPDWCMLADRFSAIVLFSANVTEGLKVSLLQQNHFLCLNEIACFQSIEINSAWDI